MSYSIQAILHNHANAKGLHKVNIQVIYKRMKAYTPTLVKIEKAFWENGQVIKSTHKKDFNAAIKEEMNKVEKRLIDALRLEPNLSKERLAQVVKGGKEANNETVYAYVCDLKKRLIGKLSNSRLSHYTTISEKIEEFKPGATFSDISVAWLNNFEAWLRTTKGRKGSLDGNTVQSNMSIVKGILQKAIVDKKMTAEQLAGYKVPRYEQKLPVYLTEAELDKIKAFVDVIDKPGHKIAGYYFLLCSYTGYRISDSRRFVYDEMVSGDKIVLRAGKNKTIVSIPLYPKLREILEFVQVNPFDLSEQKARNYIREICGFVGIKKVVIWHSSRHSFALYLISKGFSIDEVATLLGDSKDIARIYARISNTHLEEKFKERLG